MMSGTIRRPQLPTVSAQNRVLLLLACIVVPGLFLSFTWRALLVYYGFDDLMNLYGYWNTPFLSLLKGNVFFWAPSYRPLGGIVYSTIFSIFGFHPGPLYAVFYAAMLANLPLVYFLFRRLAGSEEIAAVGTLLWAFHGKLGSLYYNAGSMYDVLCFLFFSSAMLIYLKPRAEGRSLGVWRTIGFLACLICALNSKETAVTLPAILLLYEILFRAPGGRERRWRGNYVPLLLAALCVLLYLPAKLGPAGFTHDAAYISEYTLTRWLEDTGTYLAYVLYRNNPAGPLGVSPFTPAGVLVFFLGSGAAALWSRSRLAWFGLLFFVITLAPVSFIPPRLGYVLYLPLFGLALTIAVVLVRLKESFVRFLERIHTSSALSWSVGWFWMLAVIVGMIDYHFRSAAPSTWNSPHRKTVEELSRMYPAFEPGARVLFVHSSLDSDWSMVFLLRLYYRNRTVFVTELNGPTEQRIPVDQLPKYDHIFDFENGHYVELDNHDAPLSVQLHLLKADGQPGVPGETMIIGAPGAATHIVQGVLTTDNDAEACWTSEQPELRFQLSDIRHRTFRAHFSIPAETLRQTGPLLIDYYVNDHLLDQARFASGNVVFRHDVPAEWLNTRDFTSVRMRIHNPYIAPLDGRRLGVLLHGAAFGPENPDQP